MSSLSKFFDIVLFLLPSLVTGPSFHVSFRVSWFWSFNSFIYKGLTKNQIENACCLSFAQYLEIGINQEYQIWDRCLQGNVPTCYKMPELHLLLFLSY